jgi:phosphoglycerate dehydrogenase-like enzyme
LPAPSDRVRLVVAFGSRARETYWTPVARATLGFADVVEVDLPGVDPTAEQERLDGALADADGLLLAGWYDAGVGYLSKERLDGARRLRFIGSSASDRQAQFLDLDAVAAAGILVVDTSRIMSPWVAEYELALTLAALRRLPQEHELVGRGGWLNYRDVPAEIDRLAGRRVGLASFGAVHQHFARLLEPFETTWQAFDPFVQAEVVEAAGGVRSDDLVAMAASSEVFCVATPPNATTLGLIDRAVIEAIPSGGVFVLVSRMIVVDQDALVERLERGELRAGIDVYEPEPPPAHHPLRRLPNVVHPPHRAGGTLQAHRAVFEETCREAARFFAGEPVRCPLRPEQVRLVTLGTVLPD